VSAKTQGFSYLLFLVCEEEQVIKTRGKVFRIPPGHYVYVGSCGLSCSARITRHFKRKKKLFWHIDFLTRACRPVGVVTLAVEEKSLARTLTSLTYIEGFGCTDDREAPSHLFRASPIQVLDLLVTKRFREKQRSQSSSFLKSE